MLDLKLLRLGKDGLSALLGNKRYNRRDLELAVELDLSRRKLLERVESFRARRNALSGGIGELDGAEKAGRIRKLAEISRAMSDDERRLADIENRLLAVRSALPNPPVDAVPPCHDKVLRYGNERPVFSFTPLDHVRIAASHGWIGSQQGARLSGRGFHFFFGHAVMLQFALLAWAAGRLMENGFRLSIPPVLARGQALYNTGFFNDRDMELYKVEGEDLYLTGTSEVALASLHSEETVDAAVLPLRYAAYSTCFRRETGAAGMKTRGVFRVHQFDKLEMFSFCDPDLSDNEQERLLAIQEEIVSGLGLHYRVIDVAAPSLGLSAARKYDIEVWLPSVGAYREVTSCSNCTDYQARRLGARMKDEKGKRLLHTVNATALAVGRSILAVLENHQRKDGSVRVPVVLRDFIPGRPEVLG